MRRHIPHQLIERAFESVREVVDYYQRWFLQLDVSGQSRPEEDDRRAKRVRALRDVLARNDADPDQPVELDSHEENLVVTCSVYSMERVVEMKQQPGVQPEEIEGLNNALRLLYTVAKEFATNPVRVIERHDRTKPFPFDLRRVIESINAKVHTGYEDAMPADGRPVRPSAPIQRLSVMSDQDCIAQWGEEQCRQLLPDEAVEPISAPGMEAGACITIRDEDEEKDGPGIQSGTQQFGFTYEQGEVGEVEEEEFDEDGRIEFDFGLLKEPKLIALAERDLLTLQCARKSGDPRLVSVTLSAILETVLIDLALRRRHELRLRGTPDSWDLQKMLRQLLLDYSMELDMGALSKLLSCQDLLRPSALLMSPVDVDDPALEKMLESMRRFLERVSKSLRQARV